MHIPFFFFFVFESENKNNFSFTVILCTFMALLVERKREIENRRQIFVS